MTLKFDGTEKELAQARKARRGGMGSTLGGLAVTVAVFYAIWWLLLGGLSPAQLLGAVGLGGG